MKPAFRLVITALLLTTLAGCNNPPPKTGAAAPPVATYNTGLVNTLLVGDQSPVKEPMEIPFNGTMDLNYKTRDEIIRIRQNMGMREPGVKLCPTYKPSAEVFGNILDEKTWTGLKGRLMTANNIIASTEGQAEQSRFICSPYLLIGADIKPPATLDLDRNRYPTIEAFAASQFPLQCPPKKIVLDPVKATEEVTYEVSAYRNSINNYMRIPVTAQQLEVWLNGLNAHDFGYRWILVSSTTEGISKTPRIGVHPFEIKHAIGPGIDGNGLAFDNEDFRKYQFARLPAKMVIYLWKSKPAAPDATPDFTETLVFN